MADWIKKWLGTAPADKNNPPEEIVVDESAAPTKWLKKEEAAPDFSSFFDSEAIGGWGAELAEAKKTSIPPIVGVGGDRSGNRIR